ncbi:MAG: hypothetical protein DBY45_02255 [Clostridiales bacterium]|nr:MAG: hypothetical protein DBY45_02255 [Clostridiales bacterium]
MKGLLKKDFCLLSRYMRFIVIYMGAMIVLFAMTSQSAVSGFASAMSVLCIILPIYTITTMSLDETSKWDSLAIAMPLRRSQIVGSKYILAIVMLGIGVTGGAVCCGILALFHADAEVWANLTVLLVLLCYNTLMLSILIPLVFKFGGEKSRFIMMGVYMVPTFIVVFLFSRFGKNLDFESVAQDATVCALLLGGAVIIAIAAYIISYFISLGIYRRKEF